MPLRNLDAASRDHGDGDDEAGDGEQDVDPLLPSGDPGLDRLKAEIEQELAASGVKSAYDRKLNSSYYCYHKSVLSQIFKSLLERDVRLAQSVAGLFLH